MILVLDMQDRRPAWAMPLWVPERVREALEEGEASGELRVMQVPADGSGDGSARVDPTVLAAVEDADAYLGYGVPAEVLRRGQRLRWVHSGAAGVGSSLTPELRASEVVFTNSAGIHAPPMAETVLGMILHFFRGLDLALAAQARGEWDKDPFYEASTPVRELSRSTVGVLGFGGIGREVARRCAALGARVLAVRRSETEGENVALEVVERQGTPSGRSAVLDDAVRMLQGPDALVRLAEASDVLVVAAPETPETRGIVDGDLLRRMRSGTVLVNVARGGLVDEEALVDVLRAGRIRGAALDVFAQEPLPPGHPLWDLTNVLLTPHVSAVTDGFWERETALIVENVRRLREGRELVNVVDPDAGY